MLLAAGADVKAATREGAITPLFMACTNGNAAMIERVAESRRGRQHGQRQRHHRADDRRGFRQRGCRESAARSWRRRECQGNRSWPDGADVRRGAESRRRWSKVLCWRMAPTSNVATPTKTVERVRFDQDGNIVEDRPRARGGRGGRGAGRGRGRPRSPAQDADEADEAADAAAAVAANEDRRPKRQQARTRTTLAMPIGLQDAAVSCSAKPKRGAGDVAARAPRRVGPEFTGGMTALLYAAREGHMDAVRALVEGSANRQRAVSADKFTPAGDGHRQRPSRRSRCICWSTAPIRISSPFPA